MILGFVLTLWLAYMLKMILSRYALSCGSVNNRSNSGNEDASATIAGEQGEFAYLLLLLAADVVAGVGLRSALRSFLISHVPLIKFSTDVEVGAQQQERQKQRTVPLQRRDTAMAPFIVKIKGLKNEGQTCYANSVMQALASLRPLCIHVNSLQKMDCNSDEDQESIAFALHQTLTHINGHKVTRARRKGSSFLGSIFSSSTPGDPQQVTNIVARHHSQFRSRNSREQQDSHEYFSALMDILSSKHQKRGGKSSSSLDIIHATPRHTNVGMDGCRLGTEGNTCLKNHLDNKVLNQFADELEEKKHDKYNHNNYHQSPTTPSCRSADYLSCNTTNSDKEAIDPPHIQNPFDGLSGSTVKCAVCHHVRPIRYTPFLALSLPIADVPSEFLEDFLDAEFATAKVSNVQCFSCAFQRRKQELEEECVLLSDAISSIQRRRNKGKIKISQRENVRKVEDPKQEILGLAKETQRIKQTIAFLETLDPDADGDKLDCQDGEHGLGLNNLLSPIIPFRRNAFLYKVMQPPKALCIHLQRRHYDASSGQMIKVVRRVHFEENLDIRPYCGYASKFSHVPYKLMSVIEHVGNAFGGHYQTYRRVDPEEDGWVLVSDDIVSFLSWNDVKKCQAYMLFYVACQTSPT